jgi:glycosyltransferase involved in cell wall biosynthesis
MLLTVAIIQDRLASYRVPLFSALQERLREHGIALRLIYGESSDAVKTRADEGPPPWAELAETRHLALRGTQAVWQRLPRDIRRADLVIMEQGNRLLSNYPLLARRKLGGAAVAYWGHGKNYQSTRPEGVRERWKCFLLPYADWWFAYTDLTVAHLIDKGFPANRITNLNNSIDVTGFRNDLASVTPADIDRAMRDLSIPDGSRVGLYCGSIYAEKRIGLLLHSAEIIRRAAPDFHLVVVGDGPDAERVYEAATVHPWVHYVGAKQGRPKAVLFASAHVQLNPGAVGLHVLDAFTAGLPMVTRVDAPHGPEITYLESGLNGLMVESSEPGAYAEAVLGLLEDESRRESMRQACLEASWRFSIESMADRFCEGVRACLEMKGGSPPGVRSRK